MKPIDVYLTTQQETMTSVHALLHAIDFVHKKDPRFNLGIALNTYLLRELAKQASWISLPVLSVSEVPSDKPLIDISPSPERVAFWEESDCKAEKDLIVAKGVSSPAEINHFVYSEYQAILKDVFEIFDVYYGELPSEIYRISRAPLLITSRELSSAVRRCELRAGIKSGPYSVVEEGFAGWHGQEFSDWGRTIMLPRPENISTVDELFEAYGLFTSPRAAVVAVHSTEWLIPGAALHKLSKNVIWDVREATALLGESLDRRNRLTICIPSGFRTLALSGSAPDLDESHICKELAWAIKHYYEYNKPSIIKNAGLTQPTKPFVPQDYVVSYL